MQYNISILYLQTLDFIYLTSITNKHGMTSLASLYAPKRWRRGFISLSLYFLSCPFLFSPHGTKLYLFGRRCSAHCVLLYSSSSYGTVHNGCVDAVL